MRVCPGKADCRLSVRHFRFSCRPPAIRRHQYHGDPAGVIDSAQQPRKRRHGSRRQAPRPVGLMVVGGFDSILEELYPVIGKAGNTWGKDAYAALELNSRARANLISKPPESIYASYNCALNNFRSLIIAATCGGTIFSQLESPQRILDSTSLEKMGRQFSLKPSIDSMRRFSSR